MRCSSSARMWTRPSMRIPGAVSADAAGERALSASISFRHQRFSDCGHPAGEWNAPAGSISEGSISGEVSNPSALLRVPAGVHAGRAQHLGADPAESRSSEQFRSVYAAGDGLVVVAGHRGAVLRSLSVPADFPGVARARAGEDRARLSGVDRPDGADDGRHHDVDADFTTPASHPVIDAASFYAYFDSVYAQTYCRVGGIMCGIIVAYLRPHRSPAPWSPRRLLAKRVLMCVALALILACAFWPAEDGPDQLRPSSWRFSAPTA